MSEPTHDSTDVTLAEKVLEISKLLISRNSTFSINIKTASGFNFCITSDCETPITDNKKKKKPPSTIKRDQSRLQEYLRCMDSNTPDPDIIETAACKTKGKMLQCGTCEQTFTQATRLSRHMRKKHIQPGGASTPCSVAECSTNKDTCDEDTHKTLCEIVGSDFCILQYAKYDKCDKCFGGPLTREDGLI